MTITYFTAEEGNAQGNITVAWSMQALDMPTDTFVHIAVVPNQEAAKQKHADLVVNLCIEEIHFPKVVLEAHKKVKFQ